MKRPLRTSGCANLESLGPHPSVLGGHGDSENELGFGDREVVHVEDPRSEVSTMLLKEGNSQVEEGRSTPMQRGAQRNGLVEYLQPWSLSSHSLLRRSSEQQLE